MERIARVNYLLLNSLVIHRLIGRGVFLPTEAKPPCGLVVGNEGKAA